MIVAPAQTAAKRSEVSSLLPHLGHPSELGVPSVGSSGSDTAKACYVPNAMLNEINNERCPGAISDGEVRSTFGSSTAKTSSMSKT